jgi:hypothetical protein
VQLSAGLVLGSTLKTIGSPDAPPVADNVAFVPAVAGVPNGVKVMA